MNSSRQFLGFCVLFHSLRHCHFRVGSLGHQRSSEVISGNHHPLGQPRDQLEPALYENLGIHRHTDTHKHAGVSRMGWDRARRRERAVASAPSVAWDGSAPRGMACRGDVSYASLVAVREPWPACSTWREKEGVPYGRVVVEWWEPCRHEVHVDRAWGPASFACRAAVSATREITQQSARPPRAQAGRAGALSQSSGSESSRSVGHGTVSLSMTFRGWRGLVCLD